MEKKDQIINAAMRLLTEKGVQATPMSAIAKAAGTGMGTIYNYFSTKEELINAIYLYIKNLEVQFITKKTVDSSLKIKFLDYYKAFIDFNVQYPECFAFMDQMQNSPIISCITKDKGKAEFLSIIELIEKGQQEGIIKKMTIQAVLQFLGGTMTAYVRWMLSIEESEREKHLDQQLRMVWDAIKE
ncbi:TetR/AcrR family transcriptional regulator [Chryseobacterium sp. MIQD13]|uniref:TetR/AcrR family transcriptional regulator n=1 Tax=Chryseobacterium sp. MIQD13 TaxID=3422310 RepID=UPI003D2660FD